MVIELSVVQFGLKSYHAFAIEWKGKYHSHSMSAIWINKHDFRPKLHDAKFNYHLITFILNWHNLITQKHDFSQYQIFFWSSR